MEKESPNSQVVEGGQMEAQLKVQWQLSQGQLNCLTACPRKFQHLYLDQLGLPQFEVPQDQPRLGKQFHQLLHQKALGIDISPLAQTHPQLQQWLTIFAQEPPPMIVGEHHSEHLRSLLMQDYLLIAVYDLLIQGPQQAQILDWKTYQRPQDPDKLRLNWQTRLYPFLLAATSSYRPEQISMTYWFAEVPPHRPATDHLLTVPYSQEMHQQNQQDLSHLLDQLSQWFTGYEHGESFPQVPIAAGQCYTSKTVCNFVSRCQRQQEQTEALAETEELEDVAAIAEVSL